MGRQCEINGGAMRDPYHAARVRFKVARDRVIEDMLQRSQWMMVTDLAPAGGRITRKVPYHRCTPEFQRQIRDGRFKFSIPPWPTDLLDECVKAEGILQTMQRFKITDERQAEMVWKLSRE